MYIYIFPIITQNMKTKKLNKENIYKCKGRTFITDIKGFFFFH